jgi:UDP-N-acetylmuramoyl-tripeptide--D-alanyl-D-alanine ligase
MIPLRFDEVAVIVGGQLVDAPDPGQVLRAPPTADSREVTPGGLFACIRGARVDGHDFVEQAVQAGAVLMLASRSVGAPAIVVPDVVEALGALARHVLAQLPHLRVVAVTGSSGKTSTKDLIAQVASAVGPTIAPVGSLNTEVGLPLTALRADLDSRVLVLEMGARGAGHIAYLCRIATPDIGVVLNVGSAHLGEFGSVEAIAAAKGELVEALPSHGIAVLNGDDRLVSAMAERTSASVVRYGLADSVDVQAVDVVEAGGRRGFELRTPEGSAPVMLHLVGGFQVSNALAAATVGRALGLSVTTVAEILSQARPLSRWRMEIDNRRDGATIINDAYNANPESVRAALEALVEVAGDRPTWAVLGEMK